MIEAWTGFLELDSRFGPCSQARRFVASALSGRGLDGLADAAVLATSEVVSNAVTHGVPPLELRVQLTEQLLEVTVTDRAPARGPRSTGPPAGELGASLEALAASGRGIAILEALVTSWGWRPQGDCKDVWFQLRLPDTGPPL